MDSKRISLLFLHQTINDIYNYMRFSLNNLILFHSYIEKYRIKYKTALSNYGPLLEPYISKPPKKVEYTYYKTPPPNLAKDTLYVIGVKTAYAYEAVKKIFNRIKEYDKELEYYTFYLEKCILAQIENLKTFLSIFSSFMSICMHNNPM